MARLAIDSPRLVCLAYYGKTYTAGHNVAADTAGLPNRKVRTMVISPVEQAEAVVSEAEHPSCIASIAETARP